MKQEWREYLYKKIPQEIIGIVPRDRIFFNDKYLMMNSELTREFYTTLFVELARFESGFNPKATYKESFKDSKGKNVISTGLFQVSVESLRGYGVRVTQEELFDPYKNIDAMLAIAKKWIVNDGVIASDKAPWKGMARYFSPFRDAKKKEAIAKATRKVGVMSEKSGKLGVVIGHTKVSPGAVGLFKQSEYVWNGHLAELMQQRCDDIGVEMFIERRDVGGMVGAYKRMIAKKPDAIIELHFNSFNGKATGVETLHTDNYDKIGLREMDLAGKLSLAMSKALSLPVRHRNGIKEISKGERGWYNVAQTLSVPSVLIESGFADNPVDSASMQKNKSALAAALVNTFVEWKKK